jgi:hypothetical protein
MSNNKLYVIMLVYDGVNFDEPKMWVALLNSLLSIVVLTLTCDVMSKKVKAIIQRFKNTSSTI